jgi:hypothetical protein
MPCSSYDVLCHKCPQLKCIASHVHSETKEEMEKRKTNY